MLQQWCVELAVPRKDNDADGDQQQEGLDLVHAFLKDHFIGEDGEACGDGCHIAFGLLPLRFERDYSRLPELVVFVFL